MIIPIKCFTCGMVIADKYRFYTNEVRRLNLNKGEAGKNIEKGVYLTKEFNTKTSAGDVLDKLFITKMCCRRHFITHVDID
mgnify:CR=1 FL=1